jgi:putative sporulation protein YyaC
MLLRTSVGQQYINVESALAFKCFTNALHKLICKGIRNGHKCIVFLCIGTDRSTGDSLGPLIGYKIKDIKYRNIFVYGNLDSPVHAKNLKEVVLNIYSKYPNPFIIAIDACLGKMEHVGFITIGEGAIKPGSGVNKDLEPVGNMHITGIVNFGGFMDFLILQNTRLCTVMKMADLISDGIKYVLRDINTDAELVALLNE